MFCYHMLPTVPLTRSNAQLRCATRCIACFCVWWVTKAHYVTICVHNTTLHYSWLGGSGVGEQARSLFGFVVCNTGKVRRHQHRFAPNMSTMKAALPVLTRRVVGEHQEPDSTHVAIHSIQGDTSPETNPSCSTPLPAVWSSCKLRPIVYAGSCLNIGLATASDRLEI